MEPTAKGHGELSMRVFYTLDTGDYAQLKDAVVLAAAYSRPVKVYAQDGKLVATVYPDGEVVT